jgi:hypothetical protein
VALDGADAEARSLLANALRRRGDYAGGLAEAERALIISPNLAGAHAARGATLIFSGRPKEGVAAAQSTFAPSRANRTAAAFPFPQPGPTDQWGLIPPGRGTQKSAPLLN